MAIQNIQINEPGQSGVVPRQIRIETNNTRAEVIATGFLNDLVKKQKIGLLPSDCALVTTRATPAALEIATDLYDVVKSGDDWSLVASNAAVTLASGDIFVGNSNGIATGVTMSGDGTLTNAGVFAIASDSIINADVKSDAAIAFSKLEVMTSGNVLVGSAGNVAAEVTMSGDATIIASGALTIAANAVTNAKLAVDTIQYAEVTISTSELLALATTPKELVAAPGADLVVQFLGAELILDYNSVQYTESADNMVVKFENASGVAVSEIIEMTGFIDQAADTLTNAIPVKDNIVAASGCVNKALVMDNNNANFAAGDSPVRVKVTYKVITAGL